MTPFASVALFLHDGEVAFRDPRRERSRQTTQARKSASRYWTHAIRDPDELRTIIVLQVDQSRVLVATRPIGQKWIEEVTTLADAAAQPHLAACLEALDVDPAAVPPPMPDVLEINGVIYRRDL